MGTNYTLNSRATDTQLSHGFSLIELMVAVAIVGIIAAVAYPSYTQYVTKGGRAAAQAYMLALASKQEQYLPDNRQYSAAPADLLAPPGNVSSNYTVTITTGSAPPTYTITATPTADQAARDPKCKTLTLTQDGTKGINGTGTVAQCW